MKSIPSCRSFRALWLTCVIPMTLGVLSVTASAEQPKRLPPGDESIVVGQPKIFDERSLTFMWQDAQSRLAGLNFIDATSLSTAIGSLQGGNSRVRNFGFNFGINPTPSVPSDTTNGTTGTNNGTTNNPAANTGNTTNPTNGTTTGTTGGTTSGTITGGDTQPSNTTPAPTAPSLPSLPALPATFGLSASDLLAEQMELTYQVINLRFLLDRAISDRLPLLPGTPPESVPENEEYTGVRPQAVIGFQISVAPDNHLYQNALAEVVITVTNGIEKGKDIDKQLSGQLSKISLYQDQSADTATQGNGNEAIEFDWKAPSLVALLPREKTYNVATMTQDASQYGLSAAVSIVSLGISGARSNNTVYLVRDVDTVALEKPKGVTGSGSAENSISFGWQFRPVLRRRAVDAGTRQVFVVLSLPNATSQTYVGHVTAVTRWREWDRHNNRIGRILAQSDEKTLENIVIYRANAMAQLLGPQITNVSWTDTGGGKMVVDVDGRNFLNGTQVLIGDQTLSQDNGRLRILGETHLHFLTSEQELVQLKEPQIENRFGFTDLQVPTVRKQANGQGETGSYPGIEIARGKRDTYVEFITPDLCQVTLGLKSKRGVESDVKDHYFTVRVGDTVYPLSKSDLYPPDDKGSPAVYHLKFTVPYSVLANADSILVRRLFWGQNNRDVLNLADRDDIPPPIFSVRKATVLGSNTQTTEIEIAGSEFDDDLQVYVGPRKFGRYIKGFERVNKTVAIVRIPTPDFKGVKQIEVRQRWHEKPRSYTVPVDNAQVRKPQNITVRDPIQQGDITGIRISGANLDSIREIRFRDQPLRFVPGNDDGATMTLYLTNEVTVSPGKKDLVVVLADGSLLDSPLSLSVNSP